MEFRHPKYYKELRKRNKTIQEATRQVESQQSDQAISSGSEGSALPQRAPGQGPKLQATSTKPQAPSESSNKPQASSPKQQASSSKPQATSSSILEPR